MFLTRVSFGKCEGSSQREELGDSVAWYLSALAKGGQIDGDFLYDWCGDGMVAFVHLARPSAWERRFHTVWAVESLDELCQQFGREPQWTLLSDHVPRRFPSWKSAPSLVLFTHAFTDSSASVRHGRHGDPIPTYLLPLPDTEREAVYFWSNSYRYHDNVWFVSRDLEIPAYRQLADPFSGVSNEGRECCQRIESATGKPTYYYLMRYWGRRGAREFERKCPSCGGDWATDAGPGSEFWDFQFRCEPCRLVSNAGDSEEDERHARIGEYRR